MRWAISELKTIGIRATLSTTVAAPQATRQQGSVLISIFHAHKGFCGTENGLTAQRGGRDDDSSSLLLPYFLLSMPSTSYQTETKHVGQLLSSNTRERIIVPEFQRGYEWGEKQVKAFWKDLEEFKSERIKDNGPSAYFLGPIVVHKVKDEIELLDGQQRLATVTILLSVIRDAAKAIASADAEEIAKEIQKPEV